MRNKNLFIAVVVTALLPAGAQAAPTTVSYSDSIPINAVVYAPLQVVSTKTLNFGQVMKGTIVNIDAYNQETGNPTDFNSNVTPQTGEFYIKGMGGAKYSIVTNVTQSSAAGAPVLTLRAVSAAGGGLATSGQLDRDGFDYIRVFGSVDATNASYGTFSDASVTVTLNYM